MSNPNERRYVEDTLLRLERDHALMIKSAQNHEAIAADMRGRAETAMNTILALRKELDGLNG